MKDKKKKHKISQETQERVIHKDFTLQEFDVFTLDLLAQGASEEREELIKVLQIKAWQLRNFSELADKPGRADEFMKYVVGIEMAIGIIRKVASYEDRCECEGCVKVND